MNHMGSPALGCPCSVLNKNVAKSNKNRKEELPIVKSMENKIKIKIVEVVLYLIQSIILLIFFCDKGGARLLMRLVNLQII